MTYVPVASMLQQGWCDWPGMHGVNLPFRRETLSSAPSCVRRYMNAIAAAGNATGIAGCITFASVQRGAVADVERAAFGSPTPWPASGQGFTVQYLLSRESCKVYNPSNGSWEVDSEPPLGGRCAEMPNCGLCCRML